MKIIFTLILILISINTVHAKNIPSYTKENIIKAIIGEAEGEDDNGMLAIACAIRNRGNLKGVYGVYASRVVKYKYSKKTYIRAKSAYETINEPDGYMYCSMIKGATGWGNASDVKIFKTKKWFEACTITVKIGNHFFYRCDK